MFNITGKFLGFTDVYAELKTKKDNIVVTSATMKKNSIIRKKTIQSKLFSYSVAILVIFFNCQVVSRIFNWSILNLGNLFEKMLLHIIWIILTF